MGIKDLNWYKLGLILGLLLIFIATPVLAYDYSEDFIHQDAITQTKYTILTDGTGAQASLIKSVKFKQIDDFQSTTMISSEQDYTSYTWDYTVQSYSVTVDAYAGTTKVGEGLLGFNNNTASGMVSVFFYPTSWNTYDLTGVQWVNFTDPADPVTFAAHGLKDLTHTGQHRTLDATYPIGWTNPSDPVTGYIGAYTINNQFYFRNTAYLTQEGNAIHVVVYKTIGGKPYKSRVYLYKNDSEAGIITSDLALSTTDFDQYISLQPVKIVVWDRLGDWFNSSYFYSSYYGGYSASINPTNTTPLQNVTGTLSSTIDFNLDSVTQIAWEYQDTDGTHNLYENSNESRPMYYTKIGSGWYGYDLAAYDFLNYKGTGVPNPVMFKVPTSGTKTILCTVIDNAGHVYYLTAGTLTVSSGYITTRAAAIDWVLGTRIYGAQISFWDSMNASWTNTTTTSANFGEATVVTPPGRTFNIYAKAPGYTNAQLLGVPATATSVYSLFMAAAANITAAGGKTVLYVTVTDESAINGIAGAAVTVRSILDQSFYQTAYTAQSGVASFFVPNNTQYWVGASATAYQGATGNITIAAEPVYSYHLILKRLTAPPTPTATMPTPTPLPTATIPGYVPATGNFTGFWAPFLNLGVAMGADPNEVGILMALVLSLGGLVIGSIGPSMFTGTVVISPIGGEIGAFLGLTGSVAFGFFPLYLSIIVVVGLILYVSLRVYGVTR